MQRDASKERLTLVILAACTTSKDNHWWYYYYHHHHYNYYYCYYYYANSADDRSKSPFFPSLPSSPELDFSEYNTELAGVTPGETFWGTVLGFSDYYAGKA